jgi:hypothetical protein
MTEDRESNSSRIAGDSLAAMSEPYKFPEYLNFVLWTRSYMGSGPITPCHTLELGGILGNLRRERVCGVRLDSF